MSKIDSMVETAIIQAGVGVSVKDVCSAVYGHLGDLNKFPWWKKAKSKILQLEGGMDSIAAGMAGEVIARVRDGMSLVEAARASVDDLRRTWHNQYRMDRGHSLDVGAMPLDHPDVYHEPAVETPETIVFDPDNLTDPRLRRLWQERPDIHDFLADLASGVNKAQTGANAGITPQAVDSRLKRLARNYA